MARKKKKQKEDIFIYILLLSTLSVLSVVLNMYKLYIISFDILIIPIIIYFVNYLSKKFEFKETLNACLISTLMIVLYLFLFYNLENRIINIIEVFKYIFIYFLLVYLNLITNKYIKNNYLKILLNIVLVVIYFVLHYFL